MVTREPRMWRENTSVTNDTYQNHFGVRPQGKSATHQMPGASGHPTGA